MSTYNFLKSLQVAVLKLQITTSKKHNLKLNPSTQIEITIVLKTYSPVLTIYIYFEKYNL